MGVNNDPFTLFGPSDPTQQFLLNHNEHFKIKKIFLLYTFIMNTLNFEDTVVRTIRNTYTTVYVVSF